MQPALPRFRESFCGVDALSWQQRLRDRQALRNPEGSTDFDSIGASRRPAGHCGRLISLEAERVLSLARGCAGRNIAVLLSTPLLSRLARGESKFALTGSFRG